MVARRSTRLVAAAFAVALLGAACGDDGGTDQIPQTGNRPTTTESTTTIEPRDGTDGTGTTAAPGGDEDTTGTAATGTNGTAGDGGTGGGGP